jgi:uncharacterized protein with PIN domain
MRVCEKHLKRAIETLRSLKDGAEYDLCPECVQELQEILEGKPEKSERKRGRKGTPASTN